MSTKAGRQAPSQKQKQTQKKAQTQGQKQNTSRQVAQQPQAPKPTQQSLVDEQAKREARMNRQAEARAAAERRRRMRNLRRNGIIAVVVLVLVGIAAALYINEANKPGQSVSAMSNRQHIDANTLSPVPYNTDPPTNGPHVDALPEWKVYTTPITNELAVHGLEDGAVIINYKPDLDKASVDKLASITTSYIQISGGRGRVVMTPHEGLTNPVTLTTWRRIDRLDTLDEARIRRFIDAYVGIDHHENKEGERIP